MDRRVTPANGRVAARHLQGQVAADRFVEGDLHQVTGYPYLLATPDGKRDRQLLWGDDVRVFEVRDGWAFVQAPKDGYVGYLPQAALTLTQNWTHRIAARSTWAYHAPDFKLPPTHVLHCNSRLRLLETQDRWAQVALALPDADTAAPVFLPRRHIAPLSEPETDPAAVAERFLGTPYVWAANTGWGIDCSGLVQIALHACGLPCPGDSDQQETLGRTLPKDTPAIRGDLFFWKGHVAIALNDRTLIHANAGAMAVAREPLQEAISRIAAQGDGPVTRHARLD